MVMDICERKKIVLFIIKDISKHKIRFISMVKDISQREIPVISIVNDISQGTILVRQMGKGYLNVKLPLFLWPRTNLNV